MINTSAPALTPSHPLTRGQPIDSSIEQIVRCRIAACPHSFVFDKITWQFANGTLTLHGSVPSFYLKQTLQELLRNIEQIDRIANEVDVISSNGLSSDRSENLR